MAQAVISLCLLSLAFTCSPAQAHLDPPQARYSHWNSEAEAVQALWNARMTYNKKWAWGTLNQNLDPTIGASLDKGSGLTGHPPQQTPNSVYLIPKVSIRSSSLPRGLHHLAAALLTYNLAATGNNVFYPAYTDSEGLHNIFNTNYNDLGTYHVFLNAETRSRHDNDNMYLPAVVVPTCPQTVQGAVTTAWSNGNQLNPSRKQAMDVLDAGVNMVGVTNAQKWHCFSMRAAPPNVNIYNAASGYIEITHPDGMSREYYSSNGRVVYDYVNGKVYYTPTHYRPTYYLNGVLTVSQNNDCPQGQTCASPFFEIVQ